MDQRAIENYAAELHRALRRAEVVAPLTERAPDIGIEDAYRISFELLKRRQAEGERLVGKKIGVTSAAVQDMLGVRQPDFGYLTDAMQVEDGGLMPVRGQLIQPRAEAEIAFVLKADLEGPSLSAADVVRATDYVAPCLEIVDSRIRDWRIKIQDTVADNASCGRFVIGEDRFGLDGLDLAACSVVMALNGARVSSGTGKAALGSSPVACVVWLANRFAALGDPLRAGELILSGSLVPLQPVAPGDFVQADFGALGRVSARFG